MSMVAMMIIPISPIEISKITLVFNYFRCFSLSLSLSFRLYVAHSLSIAFCVFELIPLLLGITSITYARSFLGMFR